MNPPASQDLSPQRNLRRLPFVPKWIHACAWGGIFGLVLMSIGLSRHYDGQNLWRDWTESRELRQPVYAERIYPVDVFRTRANTWSNLAYVLVGFYALALGFRDGRLEPASEAGYLVHTPVMSLLFGLSCCYLGFGSGLFHASLTRLGQQLDVAAMYSPLLVIIAINMGAWIPVVKVSRRHGGLSTWPILAGLVLLASFLLYRYKWSMSSAKVLPALLLVVAGFALLDRFQAARKMAVGWLALSTVALVLARVCWQWDVAGKFSGPDAWWQGHAVWHLLTALSLAGMYLFYRSEVNFSCLEKRSNRDKHPSLDGTKVQPTASL